MDLNSASNRRSLKKDLKHPGGPGVKNPPASAGDLGSVPGQGRVHMAWSNSAHVLPLLKAVHLEPVL